MSAKYPPRVDHWPPALRSAALLTGTLVRCGPGYRPVSWPDNAVARCTAIGGLLAQRYAAIEDTAAWIWGVRRSPGSPIRLLTRRGRAPASFEAVHSDIDVLVSNYRLTPGDVVELAGYGVTSRIRTVYDLLRAQCGRERLVACRLLLLAEPERAGYSQSALRARAGPIERALSADWAPGRSGASS